MMWMVPVKYTKRELVVTVKPVGTVKCQEADGQVFLISVWYQNCTKEAVQLQMSPQKQWYKRGLDMLPALSVFLG